PVRGELRGSGEKDRQADCNEGMRVSSARRSGLLGDVDAGGLLVRERLGIVLGDGVVPVLAVVATREVVVVVSGVIHVVVVAIVIEIVILRILVVVVVRVLHVLVIERANPVLISVVETPAARVAPIVVLGLLVLVVIRPVIGRHRRPHITGIDI